MKVANISKAQFTIERYEGIVHTLKEMEKDDKKAGYTKAEALDRYDRVEINGVYCNLVWIKHDVVVGLLLTLAEQYKKEVEEL